MSKDDLIELQGTVVEVLAGGNYKIKVSENHEVLARLNGKMRQYRIRVIQGDRATVGGPPSGPGAGPPPGGAPPARPPPRALPPPAPGGGGRPPPVLAPRRDVP